MATITYGAIIVPILQDFTPNDVHHIVNHSESVFLFTSDSIWESLEEEKLTGLRGVFSLTDFRCLYQRDGETIQKFLVPVSYTHLNKRGHKVTFIAGKGSSCPFAKVIELDPSVNLNTQIPTDADIVHFNIPVPEGITKPHLLTIHGNGIPANADRNIVFVSRNHAQRLGSESFVYNGLDWDCLLYTSRCV